MAELEMNLSEQNEQLTRIISSLTQTIDNLQKALPEQRETNAKLLETIAELRGQLNKNSSMPPSSDGYKKPAPKSLRKPSGKKAGGQTGHKGQTLKITTKPDTVIPYFPSACSGCPSTSSATKQPVRLKHAVWWMLL